MLAAGAAHVSWGPVLGVEALVCFEPDMEEIDRRERAGLGAATDVDVLDLLLGLPVGAAVRTADLGGRERRALAKAPAGCVDVDSGIVTRRARPPLIASLAIIAGSRGWRHGLEQAGRFAPFCARAIVLDRPPRDPATSCAEADFFGVGLLVVTGGSEIEVLVPPEPHRSGRLAARTWWFTEEVYRTYLAGGDLGLRPVAALANG